MEVTFNFDNMLLCQDVISKIFLSYRIKHKGGVKIGLYSCASIPTVFTWGVKSNSDIFTPKSSLTVYISEKIFPQRVC